MKEKDKEKKLIVALELGSHTVRAIAGYLQTDGTYNVARIEQVANDNCIRRGTVYNIDKTVAAIRRLIDRMQEILKVNIGRCYVGVQGQSLHSEHHFVQRHLSDKPVKVDNGIIEELFAVNQDTHYPGMEILDVIAQEYKIESHVSISEESDPVGIEAENIEGRYVNVVARDNIQSTIMTCVRSAGVEPLDVFVTPLALAEQLLTESERRSGCALVDMGAETTTVMVFTRDKLRHIAVIPLGGKNITKDLTTILMDMADAENIKLHHGQAMVQPSEDEQQAHTNSIIDQERMQHIIEARVEEILRNVVHQIAESHVDDKLQTVVFTGGAANMESMCMAFQKFSQHDYKVRLAKQLIPNTQYSKIGTSLAGGNYNSLYALMTKGSENCIMTAKPEPEAVQGNLFEENKEEEVNTTTADTEKTEEQQKNVAVEEEEKPKKPSMGERFKSWWNRNWNNLQDSFEEKP